MLSDFPDFQNYLETRASLSLKDSPLTLGDGVKKDVKAILELLDMGKIRVSFWEDSEKKWVTQSWVKEAILLYFRINPMEAIHHGPFHYADQIPLKKNFSGVRIVPPACARYGSFMEPGVVLMPSYVNIGAYIGSKTMVDVWAMVGSCAQVGSNVHVSAGVTLGGVLEPAVDQPVIIEDGAFLGAGVNVVEGVRVQREAILSSGVSLTASTPIFDTTKHNFPEAFKGYVPERAIVVSGVRPKKFPWGEIHLACAYIIGYRSTNTDAKVALNEALREFSQQN